MVQPALLGANGSLPLQRKSAGRRWSSSEEAIVFRACSILEEVLEEIVGNRGIDAA